MERRCGGRTCLVCNAQPAGTTHVLQFARSLEPFPVSPFNQRAGPPMHAPLTIGFSSMPLPAKRDYVSPSLGISLEVEFDAGQEHELPFASPRSNSSLERRS